MDKNPELSAETLALQVVLMNVCAQISKLSPAHLDAIRSAFEKATDQVEQITIMLGTKAPAEYTLRAFKIVEGIKTMALRDDQ